jgi:hypothetical protein
MMMCGQTVLKYGLRLRAAQQRRAALNVIDLPIIGYLLEELIDSWSLELSCRVSKALRKLEVGRRHVLLFSFLSRCSRSSSSSTVNNNIPNRNYMFVENFSP